ncbi:MAG: CoA transferase, partial [Gammaproteobacteria bacterium]
MSTPGHGRPLDGIRVLEMGQLIAGPFAGCILGYFGAQVIKIEPPVRGDALRNWRVLKNGTSLWWRSMARNKKCITLDLRKEEGRAIAGRLAEQADVLIENFRPGTMEKWGLSPEELKKRNPGLVYTRVSGYGQSGPLASRPGFASVCEGFGGFRHINGFPGEAPVRPNLSLGDTLAALHAVIGILLALQQRSKTEGSGQVVDVAIYESVFNMLESVVPEYDGAGVVRGPSGSTLTGIVPTNTYPCADGKYVIIGGNADSIFQRLMRAAGRDDLADDPRLRDNAGRVEHQEEVDGAISRWTATLDSGEVLERLAAV